MSKLLAILDGKKTYIVAALIGVLAGVQALGYPIPEWVWIALNAVGLGTVRNALEKKD
jgi:hypothetical protein